jgi:hypothetical protein
VCRVVPRLALSRKVYGLLAFVFSYITAYLTIFTPVRRIVPGLSFSREEYRPVSLHPLPQHFMLDYIFRVLPTTSNACWSIFSPVYRIVLRLSFRREESGLMASIFHPKDCVLDYTVFTPCLQDCAEAENKQGKV